MTDPTHREVRKPEITCRELADYMAGSEIKRRSIVQGAKYKPIMRLRQHKDAHRILTKAFSRGKSLTDDFSSDIDRLSRKICDSDHETKELKINLDYLRHILRRYDQFDLPACDMEPARQFPAIEANGTRIKLRPLMVTRAVGRGNVARIGALSLRYSKGKALNEDAALYQAALTLGYMNDAPIDDVAEPHDKLCLVFDGHTTKFYNAPGNAVTRYKNMLAACASIAERWSNVSPPKGAIIK